MKDPIKFHKKLRGKISVCPKIDLKKKGILELVYTPGVGKVSSAIGKDHKLSYELTNRGNQIAIVSDGTAVLGLGNIGPEAAIPVMEGKSAIFKEFGGIDAIPLCINAKSSDEIVAFCKMIEPGFAGINLEDIGAPVCFDVLERLEKELQIPVFHDDQDGTAIVCLAGLINACRVSNKVLKELKIVINGAGAAGIAIARLLYAQGVGDMILFDREGAVFSGRSGMNKYKEAIAKKTNKKKFKGSLKDGIQGADVFIGVSSGGALSVDMVESMNKEPIVFALANPVPEIFPRDAIKGGAYIVATGRSDFPNQVNNALVFPGLFRGLLDNNIKKVTQSMKLKAAMALAYAIKPRRSAILPDVLSAKAHKALSASFKKLQ